MKSKTAATVTAGERHANNVPATGKPKLNVRLLRRIQKHIMEEPRRLKMRYWRDADIDMTAKTAPPCGTTGCIAGWAIMLTGQRLRNDRAGGIATRLLGLGRVYRVLDDAPANRLFHVDQWPEKFRRRYNDLIESPWSGRKPTMAILRKNARVTADRIEHFIKTKGAE